MADNKRIAKNTIFLYFRMIIIMAVSFFTSRVVLDKLGVNDYGLFNAVAGVVGMLAFLNNTLAKGTSRFLTFELGNGNMDKLKRTFSTAFFSFSVSAAAIIIERKFFILITSSEAYFQNFYKFYFCLTKAVNVMLLFEHFHFFV